MDLVKVLVHCGAKLDNSLLEQAFGNNESPRMMECLVREHGLGKENPKEAIHMIFLDAPCRAKKVRLVMEGQDRLDAQDICNALAEECQVLRDPGVVTALLDQGVDVNMPSSDGWTALYAALMMAPDQGPFLSIIRELLDRGADPNVFCDSRRKLFDRSIVDTPRKPPFLCSLSPCSLPSPKNLDTDVAETSSTSMHLHIQRRAEPYGC